MSDPSSSSGTANAEAAPGLPAHPARVAAAKSRAAVSVHDKQAWLDLFADDAVIEDPIGISPLDPTGLGISGKDNISQFWDTFIAPNRHTFEVHHSYAAGNEVANHMTLGLVIGTETKGSVTGVFTYKVNESGKIVSLRGFWELEAMARTMEPLS